MEFVADPFPSSLPGLTRQSIITKRSHSFLMDARVKPAHDELNKG
jgi:hypothetical protein